MPQAAALPRPHVVCKRSELSGGGTASMPVREKGRRRPGSQPARPLSCPQPPADRAKVRGFSPIASGFTAETDWLLEEDGFEPSVPQKGGQWFFETAPFNRAGLSWPRKLVAAAFQPDPLPPTKSPSPEGRSSRGAPAFFRPFGRRTNDREPAEKGVPHRTPRARTTSSKSGTSCHPAIRIFDEASYSQF
jgi:hypothetical protein